MRVAFLTISILLFAFSLSAQDFHTRNKKAIQLFSQAKQLDELGNYYQSERLLLEALQKDKSFDEAILLLHQVYIKRDLFSSSESVYLQSVNLLEPEFKNRILIDQAYFLTAEGKYEFSLEKLNQIEGSIVGLNPEFLDRLMETNQYAMNQIKNTLSIEFEELPSPLNSFDLQYFPSLTFKNELVFTSRQKVKGGDENLFTTSWADGKWNKPEPLNSRINTRRNEGTASISADGKTLVFTSCNRPDNIGSCDLYISYKIGDWSEPKLLPSTVNSEEWDSQPSLSADGTELYFTSLREGGYGKQDIWVSKVENGVWQEAINLGPAVNTAADDASPFIYYDNQTLIFATKGRLGMGGYDLFKVNRVNDTWSIPSNLGYPINDAYDQVGYSLSYDGWAYFSSSLSNGRLLLKRFRVPESIVKPIEPRFKVVELGLDSLVTRSISFLKDGEVVHQSTLDKDFKMDLVEIDKYDELTIKVSGYESKQIYVRNILPEDKIELTPIQAGQVLLETTGNFEFASDELDEELISKLDTLLEFLIKNPEVEIEVQGHTDLAGTPEYNYNLSLSRARKVAEYIINKNISTDRVSYAGFGETKPKVIDKDNSKLSINRRVEIIVKSTRY